MIKAALLETGRENMKDLHRGDEGRDYLQPEPLKEPLLGRIKQNETKQLFLSQDVSSLFLTVAFHQEKISLAVSARSHNILQTAGQQ